MRIKARRCFVPLSPSDWVAKVFLTCDNRIAVQFRQGQHVKKVLPHGPGAYLGHGGVPNGCCLYPNTQGELAETLYDMAQIWSYAGEWVHHFLYKKFGYQLTAPPAQCGNCNTSCVLTADKNPANVGDTVIFTATITNSDGSPTRGAAPEGAVTFRVDGAEIGTQTIAPNDPPSTNAASVTQTWVATEGTHTITAAYNPSDGFSSTNCEMSLTVGGVTVPCCPSLSIPATLHATISGSGGLDGTYALTWRGEDPTDPENAWTCRQNLGSCVSTPGDPDTLNFLCTITPAWELAVRGPFIYGPTHVSCDPFEVVFEGVNLSACGGGADCTVTVTT